MAKEKKTFDLEVVQAGFANGVAQGFPLSDQEKSDRLQKPLVNF